MVEWNSVPSIADVFPAGFETFRKNPVDQPVRPAGPVP